MTIRQEIEAANSKASLTLLAKRLQLRRVPKSIAMEALRQVLLNTVGDDNVVSQPLCTCGCTKKQHFMDNTTGEAFECKRPTCGCKKYTAKLS